MEWGSRDQLTALSQPPDFLYFDKIGNRVGEAGRNCCPNRIEGETDVLGAEWVLTLPEAWS